jgi:hypothetical protein
MGRAGEAPMDVRDRHLPLEADDRQEERPVRECLCLAQPRQGCLKQRGALA